MKTLRFLSQLVLTAVLISGTAINASAQKKEDWKQKIMQEKIAFFTTEMNLTQEEAQNFWPVYNQFCKEEHEAQKLIMTTYKDLNEAIESGKSEKEISACLNRYLKAREEKRDLSTAAAGRFKKVLSDEKVARLYIAEEKFKRNQIQKLHHNHGPKK
jgi:hypothetical protein